MVALSDIVENVFPSNGAVGITLTDSIRITFDREMDEESLLQAIVVEGPDTDEIIYNSYLPDTLVEGAESGILESPGYAGLVPGTLTFERLDLSADTVVSTLDTTGAGNLYRTRAAFVPSQPFRPDTEYRVHIIGDEDLTDTQDFGATDKSVFDIVSDPSNTSTGKPLVGGSYTGGLSTDTVNVRITTSGILGEAEYEWWLDSVPFDLQGPAYTHVNTLNFIKGTSISFEEGNYEVGDTWSFVLQKPEYFSGHLTFTFTTGGGSIVPVSGNTSTSPTGTPIPPELLAGATFSVVSTTPDDMEVNLPAKKYDRIIVEFSDNIDPSTISHETVQVIAEAVIEHPNLNISSPDGPVAKILTVEGNKLYIDV